MLLHLITSNVIKLFNSPEDEGRKYFQNFVIITNLHGIIAQKTLTFTKTAVKT